MAFLNIARKVFTEPWAITPAAHRTIREMVRARIDGRAAEDLERVIDQTGREQNAAALGISPANEGRPYALHGRSALVDATGVIGKRLDWMEAACGGCDVDTIVGAAQAAAADPSVSTIVLDINSPGGTVTGTPEAAERLAEVAERKELVAFTDVQMCSAAYWLASSAETIVATPSASVGSVGVYIALLDSSEAFAAQGLSMEIFKHGDLKAMGYPGTTLSDDERAYLQEQVDRTGREFEAVVTAARTIAAGSLRGQSFDGREAADRGLVDHLVRDLGELLEQLGAASA